jgi:putative PEP-CTERM system histidine kinase
MPELEFLSNVAGAAAFAILVAVLAASWKGGRVNSLVLLACAVSAAWFALQAYYYAVPSKVVISTVQYGELLRGVAWYACLLAILDLNRENGRHARRIWVPVGLIATLCVAQVLWLTAPWFAWTWGGYILRARLDLLGFLLLAVAGLVLVEMLYRNTRPEHRWSLRALCFAMGGVFTYDIFLYAHGVLFNSLSRELWSVRGAVNALSVPLLALAMVRNPHWKADIFVSRQMVFHGTAVVLVGAYLLLMAGAGYALRRFGGGWGESLQIVFFFGALLLLVMLMASSQLRARTKVFLAKHFYRNKYEYREEWLRFTRTLADCQGPRPQIEQAVIRAIAGIMDSRWGILWLRHESNQFVPVREWQVGTLPVDADEPVDSAFCEFLTRTNWIVEIRDGQAWGETGELALPAWLRRMTNAWLVVPLQLSGGLLGYIVLARSLAERSLDWEDRDLLKTVAQQTASYIALINATDALADSRQFEAYNRLSAFVVHDLKNLTAQLSLVVSNAERHRRNPEFIDDALQTVTNAVAKLNRLVTSLRTRKLEQQAVTATGLGPLLEAVVSEHRMRRPAPTLEVVENSAALVERAQLAKAIGHLVQNAQEATPESGRVGLRLRREGAAAIIEIEDTGCGMDPQFVRDHLFRPFDTTKGNAGMGIGVYEARQIINGADGQLDVRSTPGVGTTFTIRLPVAAESQDRPVRAAVAGR